MEKTAAISLTCHPERSVQHIPPCHPERSAQRVVEGSRVAPAESLPVETTRDPSIPAATPPALRMTNLTDQDKRRSLVAKRVTVIAGLVALLAGIGALWMLYGPDLLAFVSDAPRFRAWVDETGPLARLAFVVANMAQVVIAFLPGEPLELAAGYAFSFWEGTLWCLVASALGTTLVMLLVRTFGMRIVGVFFPPEKITSMRWLRDARRFELLLFLCFLIPGTPKDLLTYVAGLGTSPVWRIVALTTVGRIPSIVSSTLVAGAFGDGNYVGAAVVAVLTVVLAGVGVLAYRRLSAKHVVIENESQ